VPRDSRGEEIKEIGYRQVKMGNLIAPFPRLDDGSAYGRVLTVIPLDKETLCMPVDWLMFPLSTWFSLSLHKEMEDKGVRCPLYGWVSTVDYLANSSRKSS
jgi:hypothetical protein